MGLSAGTRLGPYEITAPLGSGGMGEVYRARDTRLDRTVAIKVLNSSLASSPELKQRFEREARAISRLNHPHICTLHDIGQQDGTDYLVMEFLEGESLAERLRRGALPSPEVLKIGIEIADALDKAHRIGIVHRDIKPGNIMLTPSGGAKLLDFGLAKPLNAMASAASNGSSAPSFTAAPTLTSPSPVSPLTTQGTVLGTVQYMSPEQIEGKEADARSDIFSFGAVLYELATGQRAFQGKSQLKVASAILEDDPQPASAIQPNIAPALNHVISTCLAKDPENRFQSAADVKLQLKWAAQTGIEAMKAPIPEVPLWRRLLPWTVSAVCAIAAVVFGILFVRLAKAPQYSTHAYLLPPEKAELQFGGLVGPFALSPDGHRLAFIAQQPNNTIWVQALNSLVAQPLTGTDGAVSPFWSPDSRYIGFFADGKLKKIDANGGPPQTLCDAPIGRGGAWSPNGTIVFAATPVSALSTVPEVGGTPAETTQLSEAESELSHRWPQFLPDGRHFLYFARSSSPEKSGIFVGLLGSKERHLVLRNLMPGFYANGYLLFLRESTLMAQPFNPDKLELTGNVVRLVEQVSSNDGGTYGLFSASDNGVLALHTGGAATGSVQLAWFDRSGKPQGLALPDAAQYFNASLSPDGSRLAFALREGLGKGGIWVLDLKRQTRTRITFGPGVQTNPVWTPDGKYVIYSSVRAPGTPPHLYKKAADGSGAEETVLDSPADSWQTPTSISRDGRYLVYAGRDTAGTRLWALPLFGERKPFLLTEPRPGIAETSGSISPDAKWLAYASTESGTLQIYLKPFPQGTAKWQVSTSGGARVAWRADGRELFFFTGTAWVMAVDFVAENGTPRMSTPHALFRPPLFSFSSLTTLTFDVTSDGQRFIMPNTPEGTAQRITLITNWLADLKK